MQLHTVNQYTTYFRCNRQKLNTQLATLKIYWLTCIMMSHTKAGVNFQQLAIENAWKTPNMCWEDTSVCYACGKTNHLHAPIIATSYMWERQQLLLITSYKDVHQEEYKILYILYDTCMVKVLLQPSNLAIVNVILPRWWNNKGVAHAYCNKLMS